MSEPRTNTPDFATWDRATLNQFAADAYVQMKADCEAIAQLRTDLHDAMELLRAQHRQSP